MISFTTEERKVTLPPVSGGILMTCLIKLPELFFKLLHTFRYSVALCDRHPCNKQTWTSEDPATEKVGTDKRGSTETLQITSEVQTPTFRLTSACLKMWPLCLFYGRESKRVWLRHCANTEMCVQRERRERREEGNSPHLQKNQTRSSEKRSAGLSGPSWSRHSWLGQGRVCPTTGTSSAYRDPGRYPQQACSLQGQKKNQICSG